MEPMNDNDQFETSEGSPAAESTNERLEAEVLTATITAFQRLTPPARHRLLLTIQTFFGLGAAAGPTSDTGRADSAPPAGYRSTPGTFSEDRTLSPKSFML